MIFVSVGTHEQPFNRLVKYMDKYAEDHPEEEVFIQSGYSTCEPVHCKWQKLLPYHEMTEKVKTARIVITHGGPSSFIMPLQIGKTPIVVPRRKEFNEHVNDHQLDFTRAVAKRQGTIIVVEDIDNLEYAIENYDSTVRNMPSGLKSNNAKFNEEIERIANDLLEKKGK